MTNQDDLPWTGERLVTSIFNHGAIDHLHRYAVAIELVKDKNVLDIASGEGYGSYLLSRYARTVIGVDIATEAIEHASKKYQRQNLQFKIGSVDRIPLQDNSIDIIISFETIEHHDKHNEMLREAKRVLRPEGLLLISSPDKVNYSEIPGVTNPYHIKELYRDEFKSLMREHFTNVLFLNQKNAYGSLIVPEINVTGYEEFSGNYESISEFKIVQDPLYNLCLASDSQIPTLPISFFSAKDSKDYLEANGEETINNKSEKNQFKTFVKLFIPPIIIRIFQRK